MNYVLLQGDHRETGYRFGAALAEQGFFLLDHVPFPITPARRQFSQACLPHYQAHFPEILQEIQGLAQGQRCEEEALQAVLFSMYALPPGCACSCFALPGLLGRNSDFLAALASQTLNVIYQLPGNHYAFRGNTTSFLQMEDGINRQGLVVGLTSVSPAEICPGLNGGMLVRLLLEKCRDVPQALEVLERLPIASAQTLTLADRQGQIALAECSAQGVEIIHPTKELPFVCATNSFHSPKMKPLQGPQDPVWQSERRYQTLTRTLARQKGQVTVQEAQKLLAGRHGFLCQYDSASGCDTLWSVVYDLKNKAIWQADGNPSRQDFRQDTRFLLD